MPATFIAITGRERLDEWKGRNLWLEFTVVSRVLRLRFAGDSWPRSGLLRRAASISLKSL
jgi:hypothetical protein